MRKVFAKRFVAVLMGLGMMAALPVTGASAAEKTFTVTFYGGEYGVYSEAYVKYLEDTYNHQEGEENVIAKATEDGYSTISVRITAGGKLPKLPQATSTADADPEISSSDDAYGVLSGNWIYSGNTKDYVSGESCMSNYNITPEFYLCSDTDVQYTLRFLLEGTEQEVAPTRYGTAPAESFASGLKVTAPDNLAEYTLNVQATLDNDSSISYANGTFTLSKGGSIAAGTTLEYVFYYTQTEHVTSTTQYEDGGTVVEYNDVNVVAGTATAGGGAAGTAGGAGGAAAGSGAAAGDGAGAAAGDGDAAVGGEGEGAGEAQQPGGGEEVIGDNETPQAGGEESIGDNETPLAESESGVSVPVVVGGIAVLLVVILLVTFLVRKRRNGADE